MVTLSWAQRKQRCDEISKYKRQKPTEFRRSGSIVQLLHQMEESAAEEHSASQPGHRKLNQLGGSFVNGKPLPLAIRQQIIQLAESGVRPCDISRQLRVSHGCISKLLSKYNETGSFQPGRAKRKTSRDVSNQVRQKIEDYKRESPGIFSWEVKDRLLQEGECTKETVPPLSVISRIVRGKSRILSEVSEASDMDSDCSDGGHVPDSPDKTGEFPFEIASQIRHDKGTEIQNGTAVPANEGAHSPLMRRGSGNGSALSERFYSMDLNNQSNHVTIKHYQRRNRTKFSAEQTSEMEKAYERTQYPDALTREELAERLNISESRIQVWFANRRSKGKKKQKPEAQDPPQAAPAPPVTASHTRVFYPVYPTVPVIRYSPYTHAVVATTCCYVPSDVPYWQARAADCHCNSCTVCQDEE